MSRLIRLQYFLMTILKFLTVKTLKTIFLASLAYQYM